MLSSFEHLREPEAGTRQLQNFELDENTIANIVSALRPYYKKGLRHDFIMSLSGWLRKQEISFGSAKKIIEQITKDDEELGNRLWTLKETYHVQDPSAVKGYSGLLSIITGIIHDEYEAQEILSTYTS